MKKTSVARDMEWKIDFGSQLNSISHNFIIKFHLSPSSQNGSIQPLFSYNIYQKKKKKEKPGKVKH